jgi:hypothetical protein
VSDDDAIEGISGPGFAKRYFGNDWKRIVADGQADLGIQLNQNLLGMRRDSLDLRRGIAAPPSRSARCGGISESAFCEIFARFPSASPTATEVST